MNLANLEQAVFSRLSGFTALTSQLVGQGIYSRKPQDVDAEDASLFPYVTFEFATIQPWDTDDTDGAQAILQVDVWSRSQSRLQISAIMDSVYDSLHKFQIVISGANTVDCLFDGSQVMSDPDGVTLHGVVEFRITYDEI
jgi:hypothetical protein